MGIPDHLTCLLRSLYADQDATVRTRHGTTDWFKLVKESIKAVRCSPVCLTYMQSTSWGMLGWTEAQVGIKTARRNINNFRYTDNTTLRLSLSLMAGSKEELQRLLKVKEESEKAGLKLNIEKTKIMASHPITSWQIDGETMEINRDFIFLDSKITTDGD